MFKYVKFEKKEYGASTKEFRDLNEDVVVNHFSVDVVSLMADNELLIDEVIDKQEAEINCEVITQDEFRELVSDSLQLQRIREVVKEKIAQRYDLADEIAINKKAADDAKKIAYDAYVSDCIFVSDELKAEIGYL